MSRDNGILYEAYSEEIIGDDAVITFSNDIHDTFKVVIPKKNLIVREAFNKKRIGVNT